MTYQFPKNFLWGTATASHQVEGGNVYNDIWLMEHTPGTVFVESSGDAVEHYRRMLAACHEHGITPMLTYHHFSSPRWLMRYGGWSGDKTRELFARFTAKYP